jgi:dTDP-4-amino-4,6-dideoxygalactose transaminase
MGIGSGDEVLLQAFTCLAVVAPILAIGATPVFGEPDTATLGLDPTKLEARITPRTRVLVVQHSFGIPADLAPILEIARRHDLRVIEDCAHTLSATYDGRPVGTFGHAAFHSYEWGKPVIIGLGGTAIVNDPALENALAAISHKWTNPTPWQRVAIDAQYVAFQSILGTPAYWWARDLYRLLGRKGLALGSFRAEEFVGVASADYRRRMHPAHRRRLTRLSRSIDEDTARRDRLAGHISAQLKARGFVGTRPLERSHPIFVKYPFFVANKTEFLERARREHIELYDMFVTPVHPIPADRWHLVRYPAGECPIAERLADTVISIPMHRRMTEARMEQALDFISMYGQPLDGI